MNSSVLLFAICAALGQANPQDTVPQRVIWVAIDSLRADHLHFAGYERQTSPWMDEQASSSAVFTSAYAPAASTGFSVAATFAGQYYSLMDYASHPPHIPASVVTLPEILRKAGFRTCAWIGNSVLIGHQTLGFDRGFDSWQGILPKRSPTPTIDEIIRIVEQNYKPSGGPEFHYFHTMDVHHPYVPPIPYDRLWPQIVPTNGVTFGEARDFDGELILSNLPYHSEKHNLSADDIAFLMTQYDGAIYYTNTRLPALLEALSYSPDRDLLIVSADHGEQFFEHGFWGHGRSVYPEETHVPLLIRGPGIVPAKHAEPVSLVDLFPTLCEMFGIETPSGLNGVNLEPVLRGTAPVRERAVYTENPYWTGGVFAPEAAVIVGHDYYRLLTNVHWRQPWRAWPIEAELFTLDRGSWDYTNQVSARMERANELNALLRIIDPRFAPYTPNAIRQGDRDVSVGPELMPPLAEGSNKKVRVEVPSIRKGPESEVTLTLPERDYVVYIATVPNRAHRLHFQYRLGPGAFQLQMKDSLTSKIFWEHALCKAERTWTDFTVVVTPPSRSSELSIAGIGTEKAVFHVRGVSLRTIDIPTFEMVPWTRVEGNEDETPKMDPEVYDAIKALGYLDGRSEALSPPKD